MPAAPCQQMRKTTSASCWAAKMPHSASRLRRARRKFHAARVRVCFIADLLVLCIIVVIRLRYKKSFR